MNIWVMFHLVCQSILQIQEVHLEEFCWFLLDLKLQLNDYYSTSQEI